MEYHFATLMQKSFRHNKTTCTLSQRAMLNDIDKIKNNFSLNSFSTNYETMFSLSSSSQHLRPQVNEIS